MCEPDVSVLNRCPPPLNADWQPSTAGCCRIGSYEPTPGASELFVYEPRVDLDANALLCFASGLLGFLTVYAPGPGEAASPAWTSSCRALDDEPKPPAPDSVDVLRLFCDIVPISVAVCASYEPGSLMKVSSSLPRFVVDLNADDGRPFCAATVHGRAHVR